MDTNRIEGAARNAFGKGEEFIGKVMERPQTQAAGLADQATGIAQNLYGRAKDGLNDAAERMPDALAQAADASQQAYRNSSKHLAAQVSKQPIETLLLVGALGYLLGWATTRAMR